MKDYALITAAIIDNVEPIKITEIIEEHNDLSTVGRLMLNEDQIEDQHIEDQWIYLLLAEQYLDNCSVYAYDGWDECSVIGAPKIEAYYYSMNIVCKGELDLDSLDRIRGNDGENLVNVGRNQDGDTLIKIKLRRGLLDRIEDENAKRARKKAEAQGLKPPEAQETDQEQNDMGGMNDGLGF